MRRKKIGWVRWMRRWREGGGGGVPTTMHPLVWPACRGDPYLHQVADLAKNFSWGGLGTTKH
jgi:hypothetical protein